MTTPDKQQNPPLLNGRHQHSHEATTRHPVAHNLIGSSTAMRRVAALVERVAGTNATVLVRGPTGSGKEVVARMLHAASERRARPLVPINCAALQEALLESELFGHVKGSFTGAAQAKPGLVEVAEGGTLFIDEIAEMAVGLQAKLLRVLEDGHYRRVGSAIEHYANIRVVAATNAALEDLISKGQFREDLYYRLNVITIALPPLRERREDVPELVEHLLTTRSVSSVHMGIDPEAMDVLVRYDWPGNVRELSNVLMRAQILAEGDTITLDDLPDGLSTSQPTAVGGFGMMTDTNCATFLVGRTRRALAARRAGERGQGARRLPPCDAEQTARDLVRLNPLCSFVVDTQHMVERQLPPQIGHRFNVGQASRPDDVSSGLEVDAA